LTAAAQKQITALALAVGFSHGFLVSAAIVLLALIIAVAVISVARGHHSGMDPMAVPAG
jgi:hypothetical protein